MLHICSWNVNGGMHDVATYLGKNIFPQYDIVCLQELHSTMSQDIPRYVTPDNPNYPNRKIDTQLYQHLVDVAGVEFTSFFTPQMEGLHDRSPYRGVQYGNALFVRKALPIQGFTGGMVYGKVNQLNTEADGGTPAGKSGQVVSIQHNGELLTIGHFHGFWSQNGKIDMPERLQQNAGIERLFVQHTMLHPQQPQILLLGDLNYTSNMQALRNLVCSSIFGHNGVRPGGVHLNNVYSITDTRTQQYKKTVREADHVIASKLLDGKVSECWVDEDVPSDHAILHVYLTN